MSRGLGRVQEGILDVLSLEPTGAIRGWCTATELTLAMYGQQASRAKLESVRRAMKSLAKAGMVELDYLTEPVRVHGARVAAGDDPIYRRPHFADRAVLAAHLTLSVEERESRAEFFRASVETLARQDERIEDAERQAR